MEKRETFFTDWESTKKQLDKIPDNENVIVQSMQVNDGITKAFVLYLATMW